MNNKRQLLIETMPTSFVLTEGKAGGPARLSCGCMSIADKATSNGRVYPFAIWSREIAKLQPKIESAQLVGAVDHPSDGHSRITDSAIKWEKIFMEGKVTLGEGVIVQTAAGKDLEALLRSGVTIGVSSRGQGSVIRQNKGGHLVDVVCEDFELLTFDAVAEPAVRGASLQLESALTQRGGLPLGEQRRIRELAGLGESSGWGVFDAESGSGIVSDTNVESDDEKHKVEKTAAAEPDFRAKLTAAIKAQKKLTVESMLPITETSWAVLEGGKRWLAVTFESRDDGSIRVMDLQPLDAAVASAASAYRAAIQRRVAGMNANTVPEQKDIDIEAMLLECQARVKTLAGVGR